MQVTDDFMNDKHLLY